MGLVRRFGVKVVWAPIGAIVVVGALLAGTLLASAAPPNLPKRTPAQLLAAMRHATLPSAMTAVISESANLGFPALPDIAGLPSAALSAASWLAGSHTVQIWYSGPQHIRIAVPVSFGETDLRVNGSQVWLWQSQGQVATHIIVAQPSGPMTSWQFSRPRVAQVARIRAFLRQRVPVRHWILRSNTKRALLQQLRIARSIRVRVAPACPAPIVRVRTFRIARMMPLRVMLRALRARAALHGKALKLLRQRAIWRSTFAPPRVPVGLGPGAISGVTPLQAAQRLLAMIGPTTKVTVAGSTVVAGRPAYQLSIEPRSNQSLIGQILIAVDAKDYFPLQVQAIPRGSSSPAFQIGFTSLTPGAPAASNFAFTPPPGAHVHVVHLPNPLAGLIGVGGLQDAGPGVVVPSVQTPASRRLKIMKLRVRPMQVDPRIKVACPSRVRLWHWQRPAAPTLSQVRPQVLGSGWLAVAVIPAGQALGALSGAPATKGASLRVGSAGQLMAVLRLLLNSATRVHGSWGSGKLISTRLLNILITSKGQVLVGAVTPAVLYADAAKVQ